MNGRVMVAAVGAATVAYGMFRLWALGWDNLIATVAWLAGGILVHDAALAPLTIGVCLLGTMLVPAAFRAPAAAGLLILGAVSLTAIPVLGRFGARPDNATLLDRNYALGWVIVAALTLLGVMAAGLVRRGLARPRPNPER